MNKVKVRRIMMSFFGVIICAISVGIFKIAALGVDPFQSRMTDLVCVILGTVIFLAGGGSVRAIPTIVGVGTIITAFFMGPLIEFFNKKFARPFLAKAGEEN